MAARHWTEEQRQRQREAIWRWKPWERSTGPQTAAGKAKVSRNGDKGGMWAKELADLRELRKTTNALLKEHREMLKQLRD